MLFVVLARGTGAIKNGCIANAIMRNATYVHTSMHSIEYLKMIL
jgi:hypothetical protein